jgi:hypothetical protein
MGRADRRRQVITRAASCEPPGSEKYFVKPVDKIRIFGYYRSIKDRIGCPVILIDGGVLL